MDYAVAIQPGSLSGSMTWDEGVDLTNNIYLSLAVERGSFFHRPNFGLRRRRRLKNTEQTAALIRSDYDEALAWLVDVGRARSVSVRSERRPEDIHRLYLYVEVEAANRQTVRFETFVEVA